MYFREQKIAQLLYLYVHFLYSYLSHRSNYTPPPNRKLELLPGQLFDYPSVFTLVLCPQTGKAASWKLASSALFPDTIITPQLPITFHPFPSPATISTEIHNETTPQLVPQGRLSCSAYSTKRALHLRDLKDQEASSCTTSGEQLMPVYTNLVRTQSRHRKLHRHSL